jgi:hypothetical protein
MSKLIVRVIHFVMQQRKQLLAIAKRAELCATKGPADERPESA